MRFFVLWLLLVSVLQAEEELSIEAFWLGPERFRMELAPEYDDEMPERVAAEVKPEESRFIHEGDVLWDLSEHYRRWDIGAAEGWIVYNETTGYLVAKAPAHELSILELRHKVDIIPKTVRLGVEVFDVEEASLGWTDWQKKWDGIEKRLLFGIAGVGRSGEVGTQKFKGPEGLECELEFQSTLDHQDGFHDIQLAWSFGTKSSKYALNTGLVIADQASYFLELGVIDEGGVRVARLVPETILVGGPPMHDWHLFEIEKEVPEVLLNRGFGRRLRCDEGGRYLCFWDVGSVMSVHLHEPSFDDPFADDDSEETSIPELAAEEKLPSILRKYFPPQKWVDSRKSLEDSGVDLVEEDFVYYGRLQGFLVAGLRNKDQLELVDQMLSELHCGAPKNFQTCFSLLVESGEERKMLAKSILSGRSGETTEVNWNWESGKWKLEAQPTIGGEGVLYDARLLSDFDDQQKFQFSSGVTYREGVHQEFLLKKTEDERYILRLEMVLVDAFGQVIKE
ncbi:MAG: hypothetical protein ACSHYB_14875 [Roseibacillus sp.]